MNANDLPITPKTEPPAAAAPKPNPRRPPRRLSPAAWYRT